MAKNQFLFVAVLLFSLISKGADSFPKGPDENLTPGVLCSRPTTYRYPEHIRYCERDVTSQEKKAIFVKYDQAGFRTRNMPRSQFKIDHYIPLCAGGANDAKNLWPQHQSIYKITDPLEALVCEKMKAGVLKQVDAIAFIKQAKNNLDEVPEIISLVQSL